MSDWQPSADFSYLKKRAELLHLIRTFFRTREVLEVETPLLCQHTVTDRYIESFSVKQAPYFLQTSPEYAMKRLLAAGSGPIFQICKAFRYEESGRQHNPEFSLLEWYRPGWNHHQLMDEMARLLQEITPFKKAQRLSYRDIFKSHLNIDVFTCEDQELKSQLVSINDIDSLDRDTCLQLLFSEKIEPHIGFEQPVFIYDYPASQAALAKIRHETTPVAERFEVFIHGTELANGFHELTNKQEQEQRFLADQDYRRAHNKTIPEMDSLFLSALEYGLPNCAGVALGIDRLMMCLHNASEIKQVIAFHWENA